MDDSRYRLLVEAVRDYAIFMLDVEGRVLTWNQGAERMKGYRPEEIIGQHISRYYLPEDAASGRPQRLLAQAEAEDRVEDEAWRVRKDGTRFWADVVITAIRDGDGRLRGFTKVTRDLSDRQALLQALRESEQRFRLLVESVQDYAIFMLDPEGRVTTWNSGAERIKGYAPEEILGRHFSVFYPPEESGAGRPERELETARTAGRYEEEGWRVRKDGSRLWASVALTAMRDESGDLLGYAKVTRDLTERRRAEEERIRLIRAQEAIRLRDEFLSIASHELRTPLTALQLHLQSLRERVEGLDAALMRKLDRANQSSGKLAELIESLLDVARISTGRMEMRLEEQDLSSLVHEVVDRNRAAGASAGCEVTEAIAPGRMAIFDALRMEQVVANLLSNAFKYAAGAPVEVALEDAPSGDGYALTVRDHGSGIEREALARIFDRFERAASVRYYGGLGLGLYVSREIVNAHGGTLSVENATGGGARFTVWLPKEGPAQEALPSPEGER